MPGEIGTTNGRTGRQRPADRIKYGEGMEGGSKEELSRGDTSGAQNGDWGEICGKFTEENVM